MLSFSPDFSPNVLQRYEDFLIYKCFVTEITHYLIKRCDEERKFIIDEVCSQRGLVVHSALNIFISIAKLHCI